MRKMNLFILAILILGTTLMSAQATRTWVSGVGDDANPCSRTAPCKTFAGAISKTAPGGEIDALDPGGFGALTITKSITIDGGGGQVASILVAGTNGIVVAAGANDIVIIRNMRFDGLRGGGNANAGLNGIRFISGAALQIENCYIFGFNQNGIDIATAGGKVFIDHTTSFNNGQNGVSVNSTATTSVSINESTLELNAQSGVSAVGFSVVDVRNSIASGNTAAGFIASTNAGTAEMNVTNSSSYFNGTGFQAGGGTNAATLRVSNDAAHNNTFGSFVIGANGTLKSFGNNISDTLGTFTAPNIGPQ